jgi:hypothetical protein
MRRHEAAARAPCTTSPVAGSRFHRHGPATTSPSETRNCPRARGGPVREFSTKNEAVKFAARQLGGHYAVYRNHKKIWPVPCPPALRWRTGKIEREGVVASLPQPHARGDRLSGTGHACSCRCAAPWVRQILVRYHASGSAVFRSRRAWRRPCIRAGLRQRGRAAKRQQRDARGFEPGKPSQPARLDPKRKGDWLLRESGRTPRSLV